MFVGKPGTRDLRIEVKIGVATDKLFHKFYNMVPFQLVAEGKAKKYIASTLVPIYCGWRQFLIGARISDPVVSKPITVWSWHILSRY